MTEKRDAGHQDAGQPTGAKRGAAAPRDLTQGPITRTLLMFSLPTLGANILQSMNGSINTVWIGRFLGEAAIAASTNANIIMFLMFSLGFGFGMAATILIGQSMGARDIVGARRALGTGLGLFAIISILIAILGWFSAGALLHALATPPAAEKLAFIYLRVIFLGLPPMFLGLLLSMGLRGIGDAMTPLRFMLLNVILDAGLNPVLILGLGPAPRMGVAGAATATLIANYVVLFGLIAYIYAKDIPIRLKGPELRFLIPDPALLKVIVVKGVPMGFQMLVMTTSGLVMIGLINREGVDVSAAYGVAQTLWTYVQMPAMAIGAAVSAMAAQNIGAGAWDRVERITRSGVGVNLLLTGGIVALLLLFDRPALALFLGADSPAIPIARHIQFIASWSFILFGITLVLFATVRANGAVLMPLVILTLGIFGARLSFAWTFLHYGQDILWWSFPVGSCVTLALALLYYRFGNWRKQGMIARTVQAEATADGVA
ncbi:MATE family efflux transporter [Sphingomonas sp. AP4-R1]|uniref:MATE family efflux transporter n=1 Tax=Sphingomonas sp. AP4-R1 TaxID=2735134 RepID=UPI00149382F2|nr:MATE family efflux transporter [Sphingomonas sp. AP4-R1]QJU57564.1 MATE family efflux transporter [Sphingomonas sp. AP4-R1]